MSRPKSVAAYPAEMFALLELQDASLPFRMPFPSENDARSFRLTWYSFRSALERELDADWGEVADQHKRDLRRTSAYAVVVRKDPFDGGVWLIFEHRVRPDVLLGVRAALAELKGAPLAVVNAEQLALEAAAHEDVLRQLGFGTGTKPAEQAPGSEPEAK